MDEDLGVLPGGRKTTVLLDALAVMLNNQGAIMLAQISALRREFEGPDQSWVELDKAALLRVLEQNVNVTDKLLNKIRDEKLPPLFPRSGP